MNCGDMQVHLFELPGFAPERSHGRVRVVVPDPDALYRLANHSRVSAHGRRTEETLARRVGGGHHTRNADVAHPTIDGAPRDPPHPQVGHVERSKILLGLLPRNCHHPAIRSTRALGDEV